jgi:hypothetical protein
MRFTHAVESINEKKVLDDVPAQKRNWKLILIAAVGAVLALTVVVWIAWPKGKPTIKAQGETNTVSSVSHIVKDSQQEDTT